MKLNMTIRIKPEHDPKEFKEGFGKGVLVTQELTLPDDVDLNSPLVASGLIDIQREFIENYIEVKLEKL